MKPKYKRTFTINRATWRCGRNGPHSHGIGDTKLINDEGFKCCLGEIGLQCGVPRGKLIYQPNPCQVIEPTRTYAAMLIGKFSHTLLGAAAMGINDDPRLTRPQREAKLKALFAKSGYLIRFTGRYGKGESK